ncbi:MAG TPA: GNAT family N-acetyltransferase [Firmicutes bacterium]|nr:GNAT family N-acetyltransferase [Bacillota bacterium]
MQIRPMEQKDFEEVMSVMVRAFQNGALYRYVAPDEKVRTEFLEKVFRARLASSLGQEEIHVAERKGQIVATAIWIRPKPAAADKSKMTGAGALSGLPSDVIERWTGFTRILLDAQRRSIRPPFWSLAPIAVLPEKQGRGIASKLIRMQLAKIDAEHLPCFLATQDAPNVDIYHRYGFRVTGEDNIFDSGVVNYTMVRMPGTPEP